MTHQAPPPSVAPGIDPGRQVAQLREALRLVEQISGRRGEQGSDEALDEAAQVSDSYDRALPIAQRRFDALAGETAVWATAGVEALLAAGAAAPPRAAAARLAEQLDRALSDLKASIGQ
jgi:hypothetical protein